MKIWIVRILLIVVILWWMHTIYDFSGDTGEQSQSLSDKITIKVVHVIEKDYDSLDVKEQKELFDRTSFYVRKTGHFGEFAILSVFVSLLLITFEWFGKHRKFLWIIPTAVCFLYALSDEIHQGFVAGRTPKVLDVGVDTMGGLCGTVFMMIIFMAVLKKKAKKEDALNDFYE